MLAFRDTYRRWRDSRTASSSASEPIVPMESSSGQAIPYERWVSVQSSIPAPTHRSMMPPTRTTTVGKLWRSISSRSERCLLAALADLIAMMMLVYVVLSAEWVVIHNGACRRYEHATESIEHIDFDVHLPRMMVKNFGATIFYSNYEAIGMREYDIDIEDAKMRDLPPTVARSSVFTTRLGGYYTTFADCVTLRSKHAMEYAVAFCFLSLMMTACAIFLHIVGPRQPYLKCIRRSTVLEILAALMSIAAMALSFYHAELVIQMQDAAQNLTKLTPRVQFGAAFYILAAATLCHMAALVIAQHKSLAILRAKRQTRQAQLNHASAHRTNNFNPSIDELASIFGIADVVDSLPTPPPAYTPRIVERGESNEIADDDEQIDLAQFVDEGIQRREEGTEQQRGRLMDTTRELV